MVAGDYAAFVNSDGPRETSNAEADTASASVENGHEVSECSRVQSFFEDQSIGRNDSVGRNPVANHDTDRCAFCFETGQRGALRTFGVLLYQPRHCVDDLPAGEAAFYARIALARPEAAARGKLAILGANGDKAGLRAAARAEFEASGDVWPFELSGKTARASVSA